MRERSASRDQYSWGTKALMSASRSHTSRVATDCTRPADRPRPDLLPQQGGDLIAHDAVQHPARLLGVHQIHIDGPGVGDGVVDHLLGDLVEGHPVGLVVRDAQHLLQVPGDGLALPVGVGGEEHFLTLLGGFFQLVNDLFLALDGLVVQFKAVLHVHAQLALGQVAHMAHGAFTS